MIATLLPPMAINTPTVVVIQHLPRDRGTSDDPWGGSHAAGATIPERIRHNPAVTLYEFTVSILCEYGLSLPSNKRHSS